MSDTHERHQSPFEKFRSVAEQAVHIVRAEHQSKAHQTLRSYPGNANKGAQNNAEGNVPWD
ncbi:unnamed protein product [Mucor hiemalis]